MTLGFAVLAGIGIGFCLGILFSRWDQGKLFELVTHTSDALVKSALFPGLGSEMFRGDTPALEQPEEAMYRTADADDHDTWPLKEQDWLNDDGPLWGEGDA